MTAQLRMSEQLYAEIVAAAVKTFETEVGGSLYGPADVNQAVVVKVTTGSTSDKRRRFSFSPNRKAVQKEIERVWVESNGEFSRIGTWHTHPGGSSSPSPTDISTAIRLNKEGNIELPFLLILATEDSDSGISVVDATVWVYDDERVQAAELRIEQSNENA